MKLESKSDAQVTLNLLNFKTVCKWNTDELQRDVKKLTGKLFAWNSLRAEAFSTLLSREDLCSNECLHLNVISLEGGF